MLLSADFHFVHRVRAVLSFDIVPVEPPRLDCLAHGCRVPVPELLFVHVSFHLVR